MVEGLSIFIFLQACSAIITVSLAVALHQDYMAWPTDVALLFAAGLVSMCLPFLSHFLNVSEDIQTSRHRSLWLTIAAFIQLCGMGIGLAAFVYGLATDLNGKCNAAGYTFCAVVRIALGFDTLTWVLFLCGFLLIMKNLVRPAKPMGVV